MDEPMRPGRYTASELADLLQHQQSFRPYAVYGERAYWESLPAELRSDWIAKGEARLHFEWPALLAVRYMDFAANGNRSRYEAVYFERRQALTALVVAECMEGRGRFIEQIVNGLWCICEESSWTVPAHMSLSRSSAGHGLPDVLDPVIDLFSAETGALLAWTAYLLADPLDRVSRMVLLRVRHELSRRLHAPFLERDDFWWMGFTERKVNNWNPWIVSNILSCFLLMEEAHDVRAQAAAKALNCLERFTAVYSEDGGCDEGPMYWGHAGASFFDALELLYLASSGRISFYEEPLVREIGRYITRVHIDGPYYVNFADGDAKFTVYGDVIYRYGLRIGDEAMLSHGAEAYRQHWKEDKMHAGLLRILPGLAVHGELMAYDRPPVRERDVWLSGIEVFAAREQTGSAKGLYVAAKGGHNGESHNHNDIGHYIVYADGQPMIIDPGVETYTSKTFSPQRYDIWTMQSAYHNLPTVNGCQQAPGEEHRAADVRYAATDELAELALDIAPAYPAEAGIAEWRRSVGLRRGAEPSVDVVDRFRLAAPTADIRLSLMTLPEPQMDDAAGGRIVLTNAAGTALGVEFDANALTAEAEPLAIEDPRLRGVWGDRLHRVVFRPKRAVQEAEWRLRIRKQ